MSSALTTEEFQRDEHPLAPSPRTRIGLAVMLGLQFWLLWALEETSDDATTPQLLAIYSAVTVGPAWVALSYSGLTRGLAAISGFAVALAALGLGWMTGAQCDAARDIHCGPVVGPYVLILTPLVLMSVVFVRAYAVDRIRAARGAPATPPYFTLFFEAWHVGLAIIHALFVLGAAWLLVGIGAQLFKLVGIGFFSDLIREGWFAFPFTGVAYGAGLAVFLAHAHTLVVVRNVILGAGGLLMPLASVIVLGFVFTAPLADTAALWELERPSAWLMAITIAVIGLYNCVFQDGADIRPLAELDGWARLRAWLYRLAVCALLPVMAVVAYGLSIRVQQYGWTAPRIYGAVLAGLLSLIVVVYCIGFARRAPVRSTRGVNAASAVIAIVLGVLLISPIARPTKLAALDQASRIENGSTPIEQADPYYLRHESGRVGYAQWERLSALPMIADNTEVAQRWAQPTAIQFSGERLPTAEQAQAYVRGAERAPDALLRSREFLRHAQSCEDRDCVLAQADLGATAQTAADQYYVVVAVDDAKRENLSLETRVFVVSGTDGPNGNDQGVNASWGRYASGISDTEALRDALDAAVETGVFETVPKAHRDLQLGDERVVTQLPQ